MGLPGRHRRRKSTELSCRSYSGQEEFGMSSFFGSFLFLFSSSFTSRCPSTSFICLSHLPGLNYFPALQQGIETTQIGKYDNTLFSVTGGTFGGAFVTWQESLDLAFFSIFLSRFLFSHTLPRQTVLCAPYAPLCALSLVFFSCRCLLQVRQKRQQESFS